MISSFKRCFFPLTHKRIKYDKINKIVWFKFVIAWLKPKVHSTVFRNAKTKTMNKDIKYQSLAIPQMIFQYNAVFLNIKSTEMNLKFFCKFTTS